MQWLQPWSFLWALLLIPAIIFLYLLKRRYTDRTISSTLLWQRVMQQMEVTRPWQRLQRHVLLFLQLLAAVLLIAGLARPAVPSDGVTANQTVVVLDTSASMLTQEEEFDRFTLAKNELLRLASSLRGEQTITVVEAGSPPRVIVSETNDRQLVEQRVNEFDIRYHVGDEAQALSLAHALASRHENSEVILISDGSGWDIPQSLAPDRFIAIGESRQNLSIAHMSTVQKDSSVEGLARLENRGSETLSGTFTLYDEAGRVLDTQMAEIVPGRSQVITWSQLPVSSYYTAQLEADQDALDADNEYWSIPTTDISRETLYVGAENAFLEKALQVSNRLEVVKALDEQTEHEEQIEKYPLIISNGAISNLPLTGNGLFFHPDSNFAGWDWRAEQQPQAAIEQIEHPIVEHVSLKEMYVAKARPVDPPSGWQTVVRSGDLPLILVNEQDDRRQVVFTFDLQQSDLPLLPEFPVLVHQIINWLLPQERTQLATAQVDEAVVIPVSADSESVTVLAPSGEKTTLATAQFSAVYTPQEIGLHEVEAGSGENKTTQYFSVAFPESETNIVPQPSLPTQQAQNPAENVIEQAGMSEIWRWFALATLLLLGVEWVVFARGY